MTPMNADYDAGCTGLVIVESAFICAVCGSRLDNMSVMSGTG